MDCGRRFGKDVLGVDRAIETAVYGQPVGWFAPTYRMMADNWRAMLELLNPIVTRSNVQERRIDLITGGSLDLWSLDAPDVARGRKYARVIVNEAALVRDLIYVWEHVLRPTLTDLAGDAFFLSTPRGLNGFYTLYQRAGDDPQWAAWRRPSSDNPHLPTAEIEQMRLTLPERVYRQELLAEFLEDGSYFQNIDACAVIEQPDRPDQHPDHVIVMGVDWAKREDFTVLTVGCRNCSRIVDWQRFNQIDYHFQRTRLIEMARRWNVKQIVAESNSIGEPNIEELQRNSLPVEGFVTTATSKPELIETLALALAQKAILIPYDYADELRAYQIEMSTSGRARFGAPLGLHDDKVISLALCWRALITPAIWIAPNPFYN